VHIFFAVLILFAILTVLVVYYIGHATGDLSSFVPTKVSIDELCTWKSSSAGIAITVANRKKSTATTATIRALWNDGYRTRF
jgi:hypothetical protein